MDSENENLQVDYRAELLTHYQSGLLQKLGMKCSEATIKKASEKNLEKMYSEYQNKYNTQITDDFISNLLFGYTQVVKFMFPKLDQKKLHEKLNDNVIVNNEIKKQIGQFMNPTLLAVGTIAASTAECSLTDCEENEDILIK